MDPLVHLRDMLPAEEALLEMEPEELAGLLIGAMLASGQRQSSRHNIMLAITQSSPSIFTLPVARVLAPILSEAWAWLERECLIVPTPTDAHWQVLSRRARIIDTPEKFEEYRGAAAFPRSLLHPAVEREAWQSFSRGRFDTAVFEAFREVEIAVRQAVGFPSHDHGVAMIRRAFHEETGPLTDMTVDDGEKEATSNLFAGRDRFLQKPGQPSPRWARRRGSGRRAAGARQPSTSCRRSENCGARASTIAQS